MMMFPIQSQVMNAPTVYLSAVQPVRESKVGIVALQHLQHCWPPDLIVTTLKMEGTSTTMESVIGKWRQVVEAVINAATVKTRMGYG